MYVGPFKDLMCGCFVNPGRSLAAPRKRPTSDSSWKNVRCRGQLMAVVAWLV